MKLIDLNIVNNGILKVLEEKLAPKVSFKLIQERNRIKPHIDSLAESINKFAEEGHADEDVLKEQNKLLNEEIDFAFNQVISLDDLPAVEGTTIEAILPIIKEQESDK